MLVVWSALNMEILYMISHKSFLQSSNSICLQVSEEKFFYITANKKQELPIATMFFVQSGWNEELLQKTFQMLPVKCCYIWLHGFRGEYF